VSLRIALLILCATGMCVPETVTAQVQDSLRVDTLAVPDSLSQEVEEGQGGISPRGAFLRSLVIPGWGHAEVASYARGAFYFTFEAASVFMILKTRYSLSRARDRNRLLEATTTARLQAAGITDPGELETALGEDPAVEDSRALVEARENQREDWVALGLFLLLLGGADAYVSAHLADFPAALEINTAPNGGMQIGVSLPLNLTRR
jgi:hypothetical protein